MKIIKIFHLIFLLLVAELEICAIAVRGFDVKNGLISNNVTSIIQDSDGYIWLGTPSGVVRYDGCSFKKPEVNNDTYIALEGNVNEIFKDCSGSLWFATDNGVARLFPDTCDFIVYNSRTQYSIMENSVQTITQDSNGNIWAGTKEYGLLVLASDDADMSIPEVIPCNPGMLSCDKVWSLVPDGDGIWAGTENGLNYVEYNNGVFSVKKYFADNSGLPGNIVKKIFRDKRGNLYLSVWDKGVYGFDPENMEFKYICPYASSMTEDDRYIWVATKRDGIYVFDPVSMSIVSHFTKDNIKKGNRIPSNYCVSIFRDSSGLIWVSFSDYGIWLIPEYTVHENAYLSGMNISSLLYDDGKIWATAQKSLYRIDIDSGGCVEYVPEGHYADAGLIELYGPDGKGIIYMGSYGGGAYLFDKATCRFSNLSSRRQGLHRISNDYVNVIRPDSKGYLWIGFWGAGVERISTECRASGESDLFSLANDVVTSVCEDEAGDIWIGTKSGGLSRFVYDADSGEYAIVPYINMPGYKLISNNTINCFCLDYEGNLWIGTEKGMDRYDAEEKIFVSCENPDVRSNRVERIYQGRDSTLWVLTDQGIVSMDNMGKTSYFSYSLYTDAEVNTSAFCIDDSNDIYIGTNDGILRLSRSSIENNEKITHPVRIVDIMAGTNNLVSQTIGDSYNVTDRILKLPYSSNTITISYSSTDYLMLDDQRYSYKLEGYDKDWFIADDDTKSVTYSNLPEGKYIFRVKTTFRNGRWNESTASAMIEIMPPWYRSLFAYFIYILLFSVVAFLVFRIVCWKIRTEHNAELHITRMNYFIRTVQQFVNPLTLIMGPVRNLLNMKQQFDQDISNSLNLIDNNARLLDSLIREILEMHNLENGMPLKIVKCDVSAFVGGIAEGYHRIAVDRGIKFSSMVQKGYTCSIDKKLIERFIVNVMSFSFKSTPPNGAISMELNKVVGDSDGFRIEIKNDGGGIPSELVGILNSNGMASMTDSGYSVKYEGPDMELLLAKSIAELHHAKFTVQSKEWVETSFVLEIDGVNERLSKDETENVKELQDYVAPDFVPYYEYSQVEFYENSGTANGVIVLICLSKEMSDFIVSSFDKYKVMVFCDKNQALRYILENAPDIVIIDDYHNNMIMSEICPVIKNDVRTNHVLMVAIIDTHSMEDKISYFNMGFDLCIEKPFTSGYLILRIKKLSDIRNSSFRLGGSVAVETEDKNENEFMAKVYDVVQRNMSNSGFNIDAFTKEMGMSRTSLHLKLKEYTSCSANEFIRNCRLKRAAELLAKGDMNVDEVCYAVGFNTPSYFTKCFRGYFGILPNEYRMKKQ